VGCAKIWLIIVDRVGIRGKLRNSGKRGWSLWKRGSWWTGHEPRGERLVTGEGGQGDRRTKKGGFQGKKGENRGGRDCASMGSHGGLWGEVGRPENEIIGGGGARGLRGKRRMGAYGMGVVKLGGGLAKKR